MERIICLSIYPSIYSSISLSEYARGKGRRKDPPLLTTSFSPHTPSFSRS